jgi:hypothetical protein
VILAIATLVSNTCEPTGGSKVKPVILGVGIAVLLLVAAPAGAAVFTIHGDWRIDGYALKRDGTLAAAIDEFGPPGSRHRRGGKCVVRWRGHGLKIVFRRHGGNPCRPQTGVFSKSRGKGPHWRTSRGLERADRLKRLQHLYPRAKWHPAGAHWSAGWWLVPRRTEAGRRYPGLLATIKGRRVSSFQIRYPAGAR